MEGDHSGSSSYTISAEVFQKWNALVTSHKKGQYTVISNAPPFIHGKETAFVWEPVRRITDQDMEWARKGGLQPETRSSPCETSDAVLRRHANYYFMSAEGLNELLQALEQRRFKAHTMTEMVLMEVAVALTKGDLDLPSRFLLANWSMVKDMFFYPVIGTKSFEIGTDKLYTHTVSEVVEKIAHGWLGFVKRWIPRSVKQSPTQLAAHHSLQRVLMLILKDRLIQVSSLSLSKEEIEALTSPVNEEERQKHGKNITIAVGMPLPTYLTKPVRLARRGTAEELTRLGLLRWKKLHQAAIMRIMERCNEQKVFPDSNTEALVFAHLMAGGADCNLVFEERYLPYLKNVQFEDIMKEELRRFVERYPHSELPSALVSLLNVFGPHKGAWIRVSRSTQVEGIARVILRSVNSKPKAEQLSSPKAIIDQAGLSFLEAAIRIAKFEPLAAYQTYYGLNCKRITEEVCDQDCKEHGYFWVLNSKALSRAGDYFTLTGTNLTLTKETLGFEQDFLLKASLRCLRLCSLFLSTGRPNSAAIAWRNMLFYASYLSSAPLEKFITVAQTVSQTFAPKYPLFKDIIPLFVANVSPNFVFVPMNCPLPWTHPVYMAESYLAKPREPVADDLIWRKKRTDKLNQSAPVEMPKETTKCCCSVM